jgi:hypothetical protein
MLEIFQALFLCSIFTVLATAQSGRISPSTTLQAETSNNTSASSSFRGLSNGTPPPRHVSKLPTRSLLYAGATTKIYARVVPFFGQDKKHVDVGYRSDDRSEVRRQVEDMISRGIDGAIVDWYGTKHADLGRVPALFREEAERHPGFTFVISEDKGAIKKCADSRDCDPTRLLVDDLNYAYDHFEQSPAYLQQGGRPVVFFFDVNLLSIDWNQVRSSVKGNPVFIFRNARAFELRVSDGAFAWVDHGGRSNMPYLDDFYKKYFEVRRSRPVLMFASVYKGFDDRVASWSENRVVPQNCGQTWLDTFAKINHYFSPSNPLDSLEIVTWNDYEEGTEIETGIDNCVELRSSIFDRTLRWDVSGNERTIYHFVVYASPDGHNLIELAQVPAQTHSFELHQEVLTPGQYQLFVQAVGNPNILNKMSSAVPWTVTEGQRQNQ